MKPNINVTPLIDVLLVLLIIFMVISPLKPAQLEARIPSESKIEGETHPDILVVRINSDETLALNNETNMGTIGDSKKLFDRLNKIFAERYKNGSLNEKLANDKSLHLADRVQKTVFIKAPKSIGYGEVVKVIDEIKLAGASPVSLQIDDLNQ